MHFICFDTEDDSPELMKAGKSGFDKRVTQIAALTDDDASFYNLGDVPEFLRWLQSRPERFIYAHNLQYDLGNLFADRLDILDCTLIGGRIIKAIWDKKIFVDSFNIWPMKAAKIGEAFGIKKLTLDIHSKEYVFTDVRIIQQAMLFAWQFCLHLGLTHLPPTLGGLCVKIWKHWNGDNFHDSSEICRAAYYGGRVELFKPRNTGTCIAWTDINSLYPYVMTLDYPGMMEDTGKTVPEFGVVTATVKAPKFELAVLPYREPDTGRILYPYGKFTGTWTAHELREAESNGYIIEKVHESYGTSDTFQPYKEFVVRLYQARLESKSEAEKTFFKLLMNNLYGRLGSTGTIGRTVWQTEQNRFDGVPYGDRVLIRYKMPLSEEVNWGHAAYVTSYGRLQLLHFIKKIGVDRMIYCDTDSTIFDCNSKTKKQIPFKTGDALGEMKLVSWEDCCECFAPKLYHAGNHYKAKGVPKTLAREFIEQRKVEFDLPFKIREAIAFFDRNNSKQLSVWRKVERQWRSNYDKKWLVKGRFYPCKVSAFV